MLAEPPDDDEIEVSIFGPGRGECVLVHLGEGQWMVVDSCTDQRQGGIPVLKYLAELGVDVSRQVILVVATHAHDDHFAGISQIFEACHSARFICSSALTSPEFFALTDIDEQEHVGLPMRAYSEYRKVFDIVSSRENDGIEPLDFARSQMILLKKHWSSVSCEVLALSPSSKALRRSLRALRKSMPLADTSGYRQPIDPNDLAIALWVRTNDKCVLLGADLLKGPKGCGWHAVLAEARPSAKASLFKVSHHGSKTGHRDGVWSEMLKRSPVALIAPFKGGNISLPKESDRVRILGLTDKAYITASPQAVMMSDQARNEAVLLGSLAANVRERWGPVGHVRARWGSDGNGWRVDMTGSAQRL